MTADDHIAFPDGVVAVSDSDGYTITFEIVQLWKKTDSISWINVIYIPMGKDELICLEESKLRV